MHGYAYLQALAGELATTSTFPPHGPNSVFAEFYAGISIGEDGTSRMGLKDLVMFRSVP